MGLLKSLGWTLSFLWETSIEIELTFLHQPQSECSFGGLILTWVIKAEAVWTHY